MSTWPHDAVAEAKAWLWIQQGRCFNASAARLEA